MNYIKRLKNKRGLGASLLVLAALSLPFQNCSKANFSQSSGDNGSNAAQAIDPAYSNLTVPHTNPNSCYTYLHATTTPVRLLFVVDESGSNTGKNGTDIQQRVRAGSIQTFFNDYQTKTDFGWGFVGFAGSSAQAYISSGGNAQSPVFSDQSSMSSAITRFRNTADGGNTPYLPALAMAGRAIQNDSSMPANTQYIVVFLSDGLPNPDVSAGNLQNNVQAILNVKPGQVSFNTVYYGPTDPEASQRLKMMAQAGNGYFLDTNASPSGQSFLISNVVNVPSSSCVP